VWVTVKPPSLSPQLFLLSHIKLANFLIKNEFYCPESPNKSALIIAIELENIEFINLILESHWNFSDENQVSTMSQAVITGNLQILDILKQNGFPLRAIDVAVVHKNYDVINWFLANGYPAETDDESTALAAKLGDIEEVDWLLKKDFKCNTRAFAGAAAYGNLDNLKWLLRHCSRNNSDELKFDPTFGEAASFGNIENMEWLLKHGFEKNVYAFSMAVSEGNIKVLDWLLKNDFPKNKDCFAIAIVEGKIEVLNWLLKNDFPKNKDCFAIAIVEGKIDGPNH
jgi:hypothetical protein